ncbi:ankyrin and het domain protein [Rutstroemia sp. NJR-2017a BBW]|nr:ankyrin and het domain protein [Rutstroemia sp. NJR-2017a BBW]
MSLRSGKRRRLDSEFDNSRGHKYKYEPLPTTKHLRFLTLHPGRFGDKIIISLDTAEFNPQDPAVFEALSYTWGSEADPEVVHVVCPKDGHLRSIRVRKNLEVALRHLRRSDRHRILWIDAICINQEDNVEKGPQVAMMGDIYRSADRVVVWLGPEADGSSAALDALGFLGFLGSQITVDWSTYEVKAADVADSKKPVPLVARELTAIYNFVSRPWFERLWIRQEIFLANAKAIICAGHHQVSWRSFRRGLLSVANKSHRHFPEHVGLENRLVHLYDFIRQPLGFSLNELRMHLQNAACLDPRDRIYAALAMLDRTEKAHLDSPNYSISPMQLYESAVRAHMKAYSGKDVLNILGDCDLQVPVASPTWVPNWAVPSHSGIRPHCTFASSTLAAWYKLLSPGRLQVASVRGGVIRTSSEIGRFTTHISDRHVAKAIRVAVFRLPDLGPHLHDNKMIESLVRTLACDSFSDIADPLDTSYPSISDSTVRMEQILSDSYSWGPHGFCARGSVGQLLFKHLRDFSSQKHIFTTMDRRIGLGPSGIRPGDEIHTILGCGFVIILRPTEERAYHVVGPGFMVGLSQGESFLGPLPEIVHFASIFRAETSRYYKCFVTKDSGEIGFEDPRFVSLGLDLTNYREKLEDDFRTCLEINPEVLQKNKININYIELI